MPLTHGLPTMVKVPTTKTTKALIRGRKAGVAFRLGLSKIEGDTGIITMDRHRLNLHRREASRKEQHRQNMTRRMMRRWMRPARRSLVALVIMPMDVTAGEVHADAAADAVGEGSEAKAAVDPLVPVAASHLAPSVR